jgi:hypothetical protein
MANQRTVPVTSLLLGCLTSVGVMMAPAHAAEAAGAAPPPPAPTTLQMAWTLGSRLSLAAVLLDAGAAAEQVNQRFESAGVIGRALGVEVPPLPSRTGAKTEDSATILVYLLRGVGEPTIKLLGDKYNAAHSRLFELAVKSNLLLMIYAPGDSIGVTIAKVIERNGPIGRLPEALWKPVVDMVRGGGAFKDVRDAVLKMHTDIAAHLETIP